jgi:hypothetical protein
VGLVLINIVLMDELWSDKAVGPMGVWCMKIVVGNGNDNGYFGCCNC